MTHNLPSLRRSGALLGLLSSLGSGLAAQTTVVVPCAADNTLYYSATGALSNGKGPSLFVGLNGLGEARRAVLRFDVAALVPAGASIVAATLKCNVAQSGYASPLDVTAHRVLQAWGEGTSVATSGNGGAGAPSTPGDATWLHASWSATLWPAAGGHFTAAPSFTMSTPQSGVVLSGPGPGTVADVQFWLDNPVQNFGWLLMSDESVPGGGTARRIDSREATSGTKPSLSVTYLLPGQFGTWGTGCPSGAGTFDFAYVGSMTGGSTIQLAHTNGPANGIGVNYFALSLDQGGTPLLPGCTLYLPMSQSWIPGFVVLFDGAGSGSSYWTLPTIYPGLYFVTQSGALENNALGLITSNAGVAVIQ